MSPQWWYDQESTINFQKFAAFFGIIEDHITQNIKSYCVEVLSTTKRWSMTKISRTLPSDLLGWLQDW